MRVPASKRGYDGSDVITRDRWTKLVIGAADGTEDEITGSTGDILFFEGLGHVGLYLGRGRMVHAPQTGRNVEIVRLGSTNYGSRLIGARRVVV